MPSTGVTVSDSRSDPVSAKIKVRAIGRNIFPSTPSRRQDRQLHHRDDGHAEDDRPAHLQRCATDDVEAVLLGVGLGQATDAVLDDDHGAVHNQAKVDRPQTHQAAGDAEVEHQVAGEEH